MATYKVLQDIEAEDKFVGPLTLKQFIFAGITFVSLYLSIVFLTRHLWVLVLPLLPIILFCGFLAWPWGRDQPTEVWLLAKIRFMVKPRRRIWDQSGMQELVTVTAPKHELEYTSDNLSQTEVRSRLKALAETIDSRGWAVKNTNVNLSTQPSYATGTNQTDRLINLSDIAREVPNADIHASDDILDERNNPTAQHLEQMISASSQAHKQAAIQSLHTTAKGDNHSKKPAGKAKAGPSDNLWFMDQPGSSLPPIPGASSGQPASSTLTSDEQALLTKLHERGDQTAASYGHTKVIQPMSGKHTTKHTRNKRSTHTNNRGEHTSPKPLNPAILELAGNDDLSVATIARQANKPRGSEPSDGEVVVPLR